MHLTRKKMIEKIKEAFLDYGYKSAIDKRIGFGLRIAHLTTSDCRALNWIVEKLENPMLIKVVFDTSMSEDKFDALICRLLYVSGKWEELSHYIIFTSFGFKECDCYAENMTDTVLKLCYITAYGEILTYIDDEKIGIKISYAIINDKEFNNGTKTTLLFKQSDLYF